MADRGTRTKVMPIKTRKEVVEEVKTFKQLTFLQTPDPNESYSSLTASSQYNFALLGSNDGLISFFSLDSLMVTACYSMKDSNLYALTVRFGFYDNFFAAAGGTTIKIYNCRERLNAKTNRRQGIMRIQTGGDESSYCYTTMFKNSTVVDSTRKNSGGKEETNASDATDRVRPLKNARTKFGKSLLMQGGNQLGPKERYPKNANANDKKKTSGPSGLNDQEKAFLKSYNPIGNRSSWFDANGSRGSNQSNININKAQDREMSDTGTIAGRPSGFSALMQTRKTEKDDTRPPDTPNDFGGADDARFFDEWLSNSDKELMSLDTEEVILSFVFIGNDSYWIAVGLCNGVIKIIDICIQTTVHVFVDNPGVGVTRISSSHDGKW